MTTSEWLINISLILVVLIQFRPRHLDARFVLIPLALVGFSAYSFLHSVPTGGNDLTLIGGLIAFGAALGIAGGLTTKVQADGTRRAVVQSTLWAASLWVVGMGARIGFVLWSEHGGASSVDHFSVTNHITGTDAWTAALILMALTEVVIRLGTIMIRGHRIAASVNAAAEGRNTTPIAQARRTRAAA